MNKYNLDQRLVYIGFQIQVIKPRPHNVWIDIEQTIFEATLEVQNDSRLFLLLCSWVSVHGDYVILEKLMKLQSKNNSPWLVALAIYAFSLGFHKWKRLIKKQSVTYSLVNKELALSAISIKGEESVFTKYGFLIAKGSIRCRNSDVLTVQRLIKQNLQYRNRFLFGASWRADVISAIEAGMKTPYEISKKLGCSYEPAHRIFNEYNLAIS